MTILPLTLLPETEQYVRSYKHIVPVSLGSQGWNCAPSMPVEDEHDRTVDEGSLDTAAIHRKQCRSFINYDSKQREQEQLQYEPQLNLCQYVIET